MFVMTECSFQVQGALRVTPGVTRTRTDGGAEWLRVTPGVTRTVEQCSAESPQFFSFAMRGAGPQRFSLDSSFSEFKF